MTRETLKYLAIFAIALSGITSAQAQTRSSSAERAIRSADQGWLQVFNGKDLEGSLLFCADDASVLAPNAPVAVGKQAIGQLFGGFFSLPGFSVSWRPTKVGVARSGELGYSSGAYELSFRDPSGKTITDRGKYLTLWQRQAGGKWKVLYDVFNTDLPAAP